VGLHWLDFTTRLPLRRVLRVLKPAVGAFVAAGHGKGMYERVWDGPHGALVSAGFRRAGRDHVRVSLPGDVCEGVGFELAARLLRLLAARPTRTDVAVDGAGFEPMRLVEAWNAGQVRTRLPRHDPDVVRWYGNGEGTTVYLGSPQSDRMLRCYDRRGPTRVELQLRRGMAQAWWRELAGRSVGIPTLALGFVAGFVDVAAPSGEDSNRSRWVRLGWWEAFVGGVAALAGLVRRAPTTLPGLVRHVWRNAAALATYVDAMAHWGFDRPEMTVAALLQQGRARRPSRHAAMLEALAQA
jgi:hypothetical protein